MSFKLFGAVSIVLLLLLSVAFVAAEQDNLSKLRDVQDQNREDLREVQEDRMDYLGEQRDKLRNTSDPRERRNIINETRENLRDSIKNGLEIRRDIRQNRSLIIAQRNVMFLELENDRKEIAVGKINAKTGLNLTIEDLENGTALRVMLENGENRTVKYLPDVASRVAQERLRINCELKNCTLELKEVGKGNMTRAAYEIEANKDSRLFFLFKKRMSVTAEVDSETGEIIEVHKPWWAFLAKESDDEVSVEVESTVNVSN